ncbi:hypothetical protein FRB98_002977 [Tulasnella sp. 332]|nr:hypothetical protein FRB98_002977 [Tulasnella sp. 332]
MLDFVFQVIVAPLLEHVYPLADPTYGRYLLPLSPFETALAADAELCVNTRRRRVFIEKDGSVGVGEDITHIEADLKRVKGNKWMYYQVWTSPIGKNGPAAGCDIIFIHGMGDYGGKWAVQVASLLRHGFRHGRSTGLQCFITNKYELANGVRAVVKDVSKWSREPPRRRMMLGESLGGYTA